MLYFPRWPLLAVGEAEGCAVVAEGRQVLAASAKAGAYGVEAGQSLRVAQALCHSIEVLARREDMEAKSFEPLVAAMEGITPKAEVFRPGELAFSMAPPARYFGGEEAVLSEVHNALAASVGPAALAEVRVGVADGVFAARQAARKGMVVPPGSSRSFLSDLGVEVLGLADLASVLKGLGIATLGLLAALPRGALAARFGPSGLLAHRLASGEDPVALEAREPARPIVVAKEADPPLCQADQIAFFGRSVAEEVFALASRGGFGIGSVSIGVDTDKGEVSLRSWRSELPMGSPELLQRLRWQVEGWLASPRRPSGGVRRLEMAAGDLLAGGNQIGLWGSRPQGERRAERAFARVEALVGEGRLLRAFPRGGRGPADLFEWVAWPSGPREPAAATEGRLGGSWPGRIAGPMPARVAPDPVPVRLMDAVGADVWVDGRGELRGVPALLVVGAEALALRAWSRPWLYDERWWEQHQKGRVARLQLLTEDGRGALVGFRSKRWLLEAVYE